MTFDFFNELAQHDVNIASKVCHCLFSTKCLLCLAMMTVPLVVHQTAGLARRQTLLSSAIQSLLLSWSRSTGLLSSQKPRQTGPQQKFERELHSWLEQFAPVRGCERGERLVAIDSFWVTTLRLSLLKLDKEDADKKEGLKFKFERADNSKCFGS